MPLKIMKPLNIPVFWGIVSCQLVNSYQNFRKDSTSVFDYP